MSHRDGSVAIASFHIRSLEWPRLWTGGQPLNLDVSRNEYRRLKEKHCRRPDGSWIAQLEPSTSASAGGSRRAASGGLKTIDAHPLGDDDDNPWKHHYASLAALDQILLDLSRLQPDNPADVDEVALARILFVWAMEHQEGGGYRQGMHEISYALYVVRQRDSGPLQDAQHVEDDAYSLFSHLMEHVAPLFYSPTSMAQQTEAVRSSLLRVDPALYAHLKAIEVEPQLFLLRWLRLLFLREMALQHCLEMWDAIFAAAATPTAAGEAFDLGGIVQWTCVAALLRMRGTLLACEQSEALVTLMREWEMPPLEQATGNIDGRGTSGQMGSAPHYSGMLVQQANLLKSRPTPATGVECAVQNQDILGIPLRHASAPSEEGVEDDARTTFSARPSSAGMISSPSGGAFSSASLSRAAFAGAQKTAQWAYQSATTRMAAATAANRSSSDRAGFPSGWNLDDVEARRLRRGRTGDTTVSEGRNVPQVEGDNEVDYVERDRRLVLALNGVVARIESKADRGASSSAAGPDPALLALKGVRDILAGRKDASDLSWIEKVGMDGVKGEGERPKSPSPTASQDPASSGPTSPCPPPSASPPSKAQIPSAPKSAHRAFARLPSPTRHPPDRPVLVDDPLGALGG
ncbi:RabGAP/TBC [Jaminaea rosea]|uniref:RabGAP/TBC n=1 Tax=Jaminaea rosea TaxID=1569628 RepID=A0A316UZ00_9BASI|nr:RabGAP/TBC [Jaminaea rosea]PWN29143.1 RabGAP/TBC [Jaminaea rosea]